MWQLIKQKMTRKTNYQFLPVCAGFMETCFGKVEISLFRYYFVLRFVCSVRVTEKVKV